MSYSSLRLPFSLFLSFALFFSLLILSFLSINLSFSISRPSFTLSLSFTRRRARAYESFPLLESPIYPLSLCLCLSLSLPLPPSSFVLLLPFNLPSALFLSLFIFLLFLSFFLSFFGRFSQLSLFSSLTPYTREIRCDNSVVCLLSS